MGLRPPDLQFTISVTLERRLFFTRNGSSVWETVSKLDVGPHKRIAVSDTHTVSRKINDYSAIIHGA